MKAGGGVSYLFGTKLLSDRALEVLFQLAEEQQLIDWVAGRLSVHKRPREVRVVDSLPRNALGKVVKRELLAGR